VIYWQLKFQQVWLLFMQSRIKAPKRKKLFKKILWVMQILPTEIY